MAGRHDLKCELLGFLGEARVRGITFSKEELTKIRSASRPIMCFCAYRGRPQEGPTDEEAKLMLQNFMRFCSSFNLGEGGMPQVVGNGKKSLGELANGMEGQSQGRVIRVDFKNRRRAE